MKNLTAKLYRPNAQEYSGTAWLCSEEYALTAAHCLGDRRKREVDKGTYRLKFLWGWLEAEVKRCDFNIDAALLSIKNKKESGAIPEVKITLGQLPSLEPWPVGTAAFQWQSWGFASGNPSAMCIYGSIDDPEGYIIDDPEEYVEKRQVAIQLTCEQGGFDKLQGMSGAAVSYDLSGCRYVAGCRYIVGLVRWAPPAFGQKAIYAAPLKRIVEVFPEMREIILSNLKFAIESVAPNLLFLPASQDRSVELGGEKVPTASKPPASQFPRLYGREDDIAEIKKRLKEEKVRLLTFVGESGTGKTALAQAVGRELQDNYHNGIYFIDLSLINDPGQVTTEIANALGVKEVKAGSLEESLIVYLGDKPTLLILDGFENLDGAKPLIEKLLAKSSRLQIIVTSRAKLDWPREHVYPVKPLTVPANRSDAASASLESLPMVALFIERARDANPAFEFDAKTLEVVADICDKLGGLPLAIELAAAQSGMLDFVSARLLEQLNGLDGASLSERLEKVVEMSYRLLDEGAQAFLRRLSIFTRACTLDAAEAVAHIGGDAQKNVREEVSLLLGKSLLREEKLPGRGVRYRMPRPILEYCAARLEETGEMPAVRHSHAVFYSLLTKKAERRLNLLSSAERKEWLELLEAEHDEIRAAINWSREGADEADSGNIDLGLQIVGNMFWFWNLRAYLTEGRRWAEAVLSEAKPTLKAETESYGKALYCVGGLAFLHGDYATAREWLAESVKVWMNLGNDRRRGYALIILGMVALSQDQLQEARECEENCVELFKKVDDMWGLALALNDLGKVCMESNDVEGARSNFQKSLAVWRELDDYWGYGLTTGNLGNLDFHSGDYLTAKQLLINASEMHRDEGNQWGLAESIKRLGHVTFAEGDYKQAAKLFYDSMALHQKIGRKQMVADCLDGLAQVATKLGQPKRAARLFGAATAIRKSIGARMSPPQTSFREANMRAALESAGRKGITSEEFQKSWGEGERWTLEIAVAKVTSYATEWST